MASVFYYKVGITKAAPEKAFLSMELLTWFADSLLSDAIAFARILSLCFLYGNWHYHMKQETPGAMFYESKPECTGANV